LDKVGFEGVDQQILRRGLDPFCRRLHQLFSALGQPSFRTRERAQGLAHVAGGRQVLAHNRLEIGRRGVRTRSPKIILRTTGLPAQQVAQVQLGQLSAGLVAKIGP
jgi:hypothetical protein